MAEPQIWDFLPNADFHPRLHCLENKLCPKVILIVTDFSLVGKSGWGPQSWAGGELYLSLITPHLVFFPFLGFCTLWPFLGDLVVKNPPAMRETQVLSLGQEDPLEEGMATHSSILAWRVPWTEEPGGLQSMGLPRAGHNWVINTFTFHINTA